jgi:wobble nucleotide-excising tRNase
MQGAGIFSDTNAKNTSLKFRKYNLIYGFNGSGKSTLSRLFSSLEQGALHPKLPSTCSFSMDLNDGTEFGCPKKSNGLERRLMVFNGDFIEKNLKWALGKANPVFFIGADQADAAAKLAEMEAKIIELETKKLGAEGTEKQAEKSLMFFKRERAKQTASRLHLGNRKYEALQLTKDFDTWMAEQLTLLTEEELVAAENLRRLAAPMPKLNVAEFDSSSVSTAFKFITDICNQTLSAIALDEAQRFPEMVVWLKEGHKFHEEKHLGDCLLCGNTLTDERKSILKTALDTQIDQFVAKLARTAERLQAVLVTLDRLEQDLASPEALSAELRSAFQEVKAELISHIRLSKSFLSRLDIVLTQKRERPATPADLSQLPTQASIEEVSAKLAEDLGKANALIQQHNGTVSDFTNHQERAEVSIRKHFIAEGREEFSAQIKALNDAIEASKVATEECNIAKTNAEELRRKIRSHGAAATAINQLIASYLGHKELAIHSTDEGYELHRHGQIIDGMPSEGEKTAIAISYFLSTLESDGRKLKEMIVVVDDPVSSLDTKALNYACSLVRNRLANSCQLFVLTHNQQCMNEFRKAWKGKARPHDDKEPTATLLFINTTILAGQTKRTSSLVEMSKLLREYDSEYHFLFSHVLKFSQAGNDHYDYGYMMPNVLRRVLDIFLAFKCPGNSGLADKIQELCGNYSDLDRDRLAALERLSQVESHSDNLDDLISFSSMTLEETKEATASLLKMMEQVDNHHLTSLKRICS